MARESYFNNVDESVNISQENGNIPNENGSILLIHMISAFLVYKGRDLDDVRPDKDSMRVKEETQIIRCYAFSKPMSLIRHA
jgi:hypothetical protein